MNENEIDRIAAAISQLRPDWPAASIATLIHRHPDLAARPRRDVAVALAWVACQAETATPARVLEAGPWWRATNAEDSTARRDVVPRDQRCRICGYRYAECRRRYDDDDHRFEPLADADRPRLDNPTLVADSIDAALEEARR